jgi:hypothetical protein
MLFPVQFCSGCATGRSILAVGESPVPNRPGAKETSPADPSREWMDDLERRLAKVEKRIAILSIAVGHASLREFDLLRHLGVATAAAERDAAELLAMMTELGDVDP